MSRMSLKSSQLAEFEYAISPGYDVRQKSYGFDSSVHRDPLMYVNYGVNRRLFYHGSPLISVMRHIS